MHDSRATKINVLIEAISVTVSCNNLMLKGHKLLSKSGSGINT